MNQPLGLWAFDKHALGERTGTLRRKSNALSSFPFGFLKLMFIIMFPIKQKTRTKQEGEAGPLHLNESLQFLDFKRTAMNPRPARSSAEGRCCHPRGNTRRSALPGGSLAFPAVRPLETSVPHFKMKVAGPKSHVRNYKPDFPVATFVSTTELGATATPL